ncbi:MAG: YihY/virulence factor BrkB family protein, partial [Desulfobacteraceae bacterium]|nr:YihY/virulence factor BrkB family protein [Desulfobacteraceae bacterium]
VIRNRGENIKSLLNRYWHFGCGVFRISGKEFVRDRCSLQASALTLYTLLAIVPVMAMAFGIAKGFGFQKYLETRILSLFAGQEQIIQNVLAFSVNLLERTKGGLMAVLGIIFLMYALIKLMGHMEDTFNRIWRVKGNRFIIRKITDYFTIAMAAGLLVIFSGSATIFITGYLEKFMEILDLPASLGSLISFGLNIFPFVTVWMVFIFFYMFIPNKNVNVRAALAGGIIAGTIFQLAQIAYVQFQVGVSAYNAIYGSFAAIPLFLMWLKASWTIVLFGAEISFVWENFDTLQTDGPEYEHISIRVKKLIILRIAVFCVNRFAQGRAPVTSLSVAAHLNLSVNITSVFMEKLVHSRILFKVSDPEPGFTPARDIEFLTVMDVVTAFENMGEDDLYLGDTLELTALEQNLESFAAAARQSSGERLLKDV